MDITGRFVLKYPSGKYVALDHGNGGVPYGTDDLRQAELWGTSKQADGFRRHYVDERFTLHIISHVKVSPPVSLNRGAPQYVLLTYRFFGEPVARVMEAGAAAKDVASMEKCIEYTEIMVTPIPLESAEHPH